ncbi:MAG: hypothetical protein KDC79_17560 [Cyclobacteriaceae bacterium]|nr:hypothetical protein [Cyclobacteriaceae bacterium]
MKGILTAKQAGNILLVIFSLMILFHIVVLLGFVPINMVWGGRVETREELVYFELFSIAVTVVAILAVTIRTGYLNWPRFMSAAKVAMWILFALFVLNTIGNAFAVTNIERYGAGIVTLLLSFLSWRVAVEK